MSRSLAHVARITRVLFSLAVLLAVTSGAHADSFGWLAGQQNPDGTFSAGTVISSTATPEAGLTLLLDPSRSSAAIAAANSQTPLPTSTTEDLSAGLSLRARLGLETAFWMTQLLTRQNEDGGFGGFPGFSSDAASTAAALIALADVRSANRDVIEPALSWLTVNQASEGAFFLYVDPQRSLWSVALASEAMQRYRFLYNLGAAITAANQLLRAELQAGHIGEPWLKARALLPLLSFGSRDALINAALTDLSGAASPDGSWTADGWATAIAARAIYLADHAQPQDPVVRMSAITGRLVSAADGQPLAGAAIALSGTVTRQVAAGADGAFSIGDVPAG